MRAIVMFGPGDVRIENVPDSTIIEPTDALILVTRVVYLILLVISTKCLMVTEQWMNVRQLRP